MTLRRALLAAAAPLLLAACPTARMHAPEVDVRLAVPAAAFAPGDTVRLTAVVRNPSGKPLTLEFATACWLHFYVLAADQRVVKGPPEESGCAPTPTRITLAPGEERRVEERWNSAEMAGGGAAAAGPLTTYVVLEEHHLERGGERVFKAGHRFGETQLRVAGSGAP